VEKIFQQILYEALNLEPMKVMNVPPVVIDLITRCTAKPPAQRPATLGAVADEIDRILNPARPVSGRGRPSSDSHPLPAPHALREELSPTVTSTIPTPQQQPVAVHAHRAVEGLPEFFEVLPAPLRTQGGLMALAGALVLLTAFFVYVVLHMARVI
jgi:hypothetical protein